MRNFRTPIMWTLDREHVPLLGSARGQGPFIPASRPRPPGPQLRLSGVTRDNTGAVLASCEVELYRRSQDQDRGVFVERTTSDGGGNFSFVVGMGMQYQYFAYKAGSPDVAGISLRTEVGV